MKIAILGCGVAGLSAARELRRHGHDVSLFDKSRGVGGRMSTRYAGERDAGESHAGEWEFDHGAQFFTAQDPYFKAAIDEAIAAGCAAPWPANALYLDGEGSVSPDKGRARYVGLPRMNSLPKYWAKDFDISLGRRVTKITKSKTWTLTFEDSGAATGFDAVICTLPPAQAKLILPKSFPHIDTVKSAKMHACFCLMVGLETAIDPGWATLRAKNLPIDWLAINHAKPGRSKSAGTVVVHSEAGWSDAHAESDRDWIQEIMIKTASALIGYPLDAAPHIALHRWLYASSQISPNAPCLASDGLVVAGDWCLGGRVQGAWLSGRATAKALL